MKRYIKTSDTIDKKTGKPVNYYNYFRSSDASAKCRELDGLGYNKKQFKSYKHAWYQVYENDNNIAVVYYGDGNDNYTRPY